MEMRVSCFVALLDFGGDFDAVWSPGESYSHKDMEMSPNISIEKQSNY